MNYLYYACFLLIIKVTGVVTKTLLFDGHLFNPLHDLIPNDVI